MDKREIQNSNRLNLIGAISAGVIVLVYFVELVVIVGYGLPPSTVAGWFSLLERHRTIGLIQTFALDLIAFAFHAPLYTALYFFLKQTKKVSSLLLLSILFGFIGIAVYFSTNITFSMLYLSDQYASAASLAQRSQLLASGQTLLAIFNGTGPFVAYFMYAVSGILVSIVMLQSHQFGRGVAIAGIIGNALELGLPPTIDPPFFLRVDPILIGIGGVVLIFWYVAIAVKFSRTRDTSTQPPERRV